MSDVTSSTTNQVYNTREEANLYAQVARVILILMPRSFMAAGFDSNGSLLTISNNSYTQNNTPWILDFFEHQFMHNPLAANTKKVVALYVAHEQSMLVPAQLYDESTAGSWLKDLHFIESSETISSYSVQPDNAYYIGAWPAAIKSLIGRYFPGRKILPIDYYQFTRQDRGTDKISCCILKNEVCATLYKDDKLQWHQVFKYETPEDIAYHISLLLKLHHIGKENIVLQMAAAGPEMSETINFLTQYFPGLKEGDDRVYGDRNWASTVYLIEQLYTCAL